MLKLTDKYAVEFDYHNSVSLHKWEDSHILESGKNKGKMSEAGWKPMSKYFSNIEDAVKYVAVIESRDENTLEEFLEQYHSMTKEMVSNVQNSYLNGLQEPVEPLINKS